MTTPKRARREHPEDRANRLRAQRRAKENIEEFLRLRADKIRRSIQTYPDSEGLALFESLREEFWGTTRWTG